MNVPVTGIDADQLAKRFGLTARQANAWLRKLPTSKVGRTRFTTEAWLVGWLAEHVENPPLPTSYNPLDEAVLVRMEWALQKLVERGVVRIEPPKEAA